MVTAVPRGAAEEESALFHGLNFSLQQGAEHKDKLIIYNRSCQEESSLRGLQSLGKK